MATATSRPRRALGSPSAVLFLALFASQSGVLVLSPILSAVASDFGVSIAVAGQLRIVAAPFAALVALGAGRALARVSPRALLGAGSILLAVGSLASAAAPTFTLLALAQVPLWAGIAILLAASVAAAGAWSPPERRARVVAHAFAGPPTAWIVGMPVIGLVAGTDWRLAFLVLPLPAAVLAGLAAAARPGDGTLPEGAASLTRLLRGGEPRRWAIGELLANSAWAGMLVFSGALFTERYGTSPTATGLVLASVAVAYLAGNRQAGRARPGAARRTMLAATWAAAVAAALTWLLAPDVWVTLALFAATAALAAMRTVAGTVHGFAVSGDLGREVGTVRAVTTQIGYLIGSVVGGAALAVGGFGLLALAFGGLFLGATVPYLSLRGGRFGLAVRPARA